MDLKRKELLWMGLILLLLVGIFFISLRIRLGPLYQVILIEPSGLIQQRPWLDFNGQEFKQGFFPLWNPYTGFGEPHLANLQSAVFYPLNLVVYFFGSKSGFELWLFLRLWLGGFFLYIFLRRLGLDIIPSLGGALVWPLGGYGLWFMQLVELNSQILLPLLLIACYELSRRIAWKNFLLVSVLGWLIILGGHPEAIFNSGLVSGLYFIFRIFKQGIPEREKLRRIVIFSLAGIFSIYLSLVILVPFLNYFFRCWHLHYSGFGFFHLDIKTIGSLFLPGVKFIDRGSGGILIELLNGGLWQVYKAGYIKTIAPGLMPGIGIIGMALVFMGLIRLRSASWEFSFFTILLIGFLGLTYGIAPFRWIGFLPFFSSASNYKFYYSEIYLGFSILISLGLSWFNLRSRKLSGLIFFIFLLSLFFQSFAVKPYLDFKIKGLAEKDWLKELINKPDKQIYRVAFIDEMPLLVPNLGMLYQINDISSSDALFPKAYVQIMQNLNALEDENLVSYFYPKYYFRLLEKSLSRNDLARLRDMAGVKWLVGKDLSNKLWQRYNYQIKKFGEVEIAESQSAYPKAVIYFYEKVFISPGAESYIYDITGIGVPEIKHYSSQKILIEAENAAEAKLVLNSYYYPGWRCWLEGKELRIEKIEEVYGEPMGIDFGQGAGQIVFKFAPLDFEIGLWMSFSGLVMIIFLVILRGRDVKKA